MSPRQRVAWHLALAAWLSLIALALVWEIWIAPLRPGGSWLALKALPLALALRGLLRADPYTMQWALMLSLAYLLEGAVRVFDPPPVNLLASIEIALALLFFVAAIVYLRPLKLAAKARERAK
ncbi:MAG: DUF2069 domain-containing protein [Burkholderiaceae bacterium]